MNSPKESLPDSEIAVRLAKLWPHREHEANGVLALLCRIGLHRWRRLDVATLVPEKDIRYCFRCSKVKVDGVVYEI
jgi:hypothetical protein